MLGDHITPRAVNVQRLKSADVKLSSSILDVAAPDQNPLTLTMKRVAFQVSFPLLSLRCV